MADTIAAIATAPAAGAIAIIRLSGADSAAAAGQVFRAQRAMTEHPREMIYGSFANAAGEVIDHGLAVYMRAPHSYTGEDTVELFCHGSPVVQRELLAALYRAGARPANPGEFTQRAFLNGKMDLVQAEAVIDLIDAETTESAKNAAAQMKGRMGGEITAVRDRLLDTIAAFYAYVDYPDEEIDMPTLAQTQEDLEQACATLTQLLGSFDQGQMIKNGVRTAIIGRPNAGKSSVLNALLGFSRSIVSDIPGTTRDTVEEKARVGSVVLHLIDTAGLRRAEDRVEQLGIERTGAAVHAADLLLVVFDGNAPWTAEDEETLQLAKERRAIALVNKSDLPLEINLARLRDQFGTRLCIVSAKEQQGFEALRAAIDEMFAAELPPCDGKIVTNARHAAALEKAREHVRHAAEALQGGLTPDLAISDMELAVDALGEITGETASEQVLHRIFERFCVGK